MEVDPSCSALQMVAYLDLICVTVAAALWYGFPEFGAWPLGIAAVPWLIRRFVTGHLSARTPFDLPLVIFLITAGISIWAAYDLETALAKFWIIAGGILLYYAFANAIVTNPVTMPRQLARFLAFAGIAVALYFLATNDWRQYPGKIAGLAVIGELLEAQLPAFPGHRLHPNVVGGIVAVLIPFGVSVALDLNQRVDGKKSTPVKRGTALLLLALMVFGLLMSSSRGAWIGLTGAALFACLWIRTASFTRLRPARYARWFHGILVLLVILLLPLASSEGERFSGIPVMNPVGAGAYDVIESRLELYRNSLILALDYPFIGAGLGGFSMLYSTYSLLIHVGHSAHSHNLYLDVAIQQGLIALLALLSSWVFAARQVVRGVGLTIWHGAAAIAIGVIALHGLMDDAIYGSRALLLLFIPLAFFVGEVKTTAGQTNVTPIQGFKRYRVLVILIGVLGLVSSIGYKPLLSQWYSNLAAVEQSRVELGTYIWPTWPLQDELRRQLDIRQAVEHYEWALVLNDRNPSANRRLGQIELSLGEYEDALVHLTAAYDVMPWDNATRQLLGEAYLVNGRLTEGNELWSTVERTRKQLEIRAYWYRYIGDAQRLSWIQSSLTPPLQECSPCKR